MPLSAIRKISFTINTVIEYQHRFLLQLVYDICSDYDLVNIILKQWLYFSLESKKLPKRLAGKSDVMPTHLEMSSD